MGTTSPSKLENLSAIQLTIDGPGSSRGIRELESEATLTIGANRSCGIPLEGPGVAPIHCVLRFSDGELWVQDWYSSDGTFVDGQRVSEETVLPPGSLLTVGPYTISWEAPRSANEAESAKANPSIEAAFDAPQTDSLLPAVSDSQQTTYVTEKKMDGPVLAEDFGDPDVAGDRGGAPLLLDEMEADPHTMEMLRAEMEQLQWDLADRDQQLEELRAQLSAQDGTFAEEPPASDVDAALVTRLEELLDELDRSDQRIGQLEESLRCADEATQAAREERRHIDEWVNDIERRLREREEEQQAEHEVLQQRLAETISDRDDLEERLRRYAAKPATADVSKQELDRLGQKNAELQKQVECLRDERNQLSEKLEELSNAGRAEDIEARIQVATREEQVRIAQEKALLARQQADLTAMRSELDHLTQGPGRDACDIDNRMRAFREHLREIHDEEQRQRSERGLATRLSALWRRLDGRA
jgi:pSer/pThr/pTyr-binding forkhead associated (FHA) protein